MLSDTELMHHVHGCKENNTRSQQAIYNYLLEYCQQCCKRYVNNPMDLMEIVQDGLVKILRDVHKFQPSYSNVIASFKSWVRTIIKHTAIDHFRKNKKNLLVYPGMENISLDGEYGSRGVNLSVKEINAAIRMISPACRTVLTLFVLEGFDHQEIAGQLGISVGTSKSNLFKARRQLGKVLAEWNDYYLLQDNQYS